MNSQTIERVIFFGRMNDSYSEKCLHHLRTIGFDVKPVWSKERGEKLPNEVMSYSCEYIICFRSYFIVPESILNSAKKACINFHPGPPEYPGSGGINFSLYNGDSKFGVTAHLMDEKVDNGSILDIHYFPIEKSDNISSLLRKTHNELYNLFIEFTANLKNEGLTYLENKVVEQNQVEWSSVKRKAKDIDIFNKSMFIRMKTN